MYQNKTKSSRNYKCLQNVNAQYKTHVHVFVERFSDEYVTLNCMCPNLDKSTKGSKTKQMINKEKRNKLHHDDYQRLIHNQS